MAGCARSTRYGLKFESFRVYVCGTQCAQRALGFRVWKFYSLFYCMQRARLQGSKVPAFQGCRVPESLRVPGCQGSKVSGFHGRRFQGSRVSGFQGSGVQGSRVPGFRGSKVPGFQGSRVPGFQGSIPDFEGCKSPRASPSPRDWNPTGPAVGNLCLIILSANNNLSKKTKKRCFKPCKVIPTNLET